MRGRSFATAALTALSLAYAASALFLRKIGDTYASIDCVRSRVIPFIRIRHSDTFYINRKAAPCFITRFGNENRCSDNCSDVRISVLAKPKDMDDVIGELYDSLKAKQTTFADLQNRLTDAGISLEGCKKPDDVIRRVAQLEVMGKEGVEDEIRKSDPQFQALLSDIYAAKLTDYNCKSTQGKVDYVTSLRTWLTSKNIQVDRDASDEQVLQRAAEVESSERLASQLPATKSCNRGTQKIESYKDEANSIFGVYKKIQDEKGKAEFISQIKEELSKLSVDYRDCKKDEDLINRLAYARVFPQEEAPKAKPAKGVSFKLSKNRGPKNPFMNNQEPFQSLFDFGNMGGLFDLGGGMFDNDQDVSGLFGDQDSLEGSFSVLKDIAKMFGVDIGGPEKNKIVFDNQEPSPAISDVDSEDSDDDEEDEIHDEELHSIFTKAKESGDRALTSILTKCVKENKIREALKMANNKGYEAAKEAYKQDKSVLYILEKLYERGVFE